MYGGRVMLFIIFIISLFLSTTNIYSNNYTIQRNESLWEIANKKK